jgi:tetratricopeptide (TPR) repeat protein
VSGDQPEAGLLLSLIGRDHEVRVLERAVDDARQGRTQLVEVVGEAGMGKTRLVEELAGLAPAFYHHAAVCERYRTSDAYFPVRSLLRTVVGIPLPAGAREAGELLEQWLSDVAPELAPLLVVPFGAETEAAGEPGGRDPARRRQLMHGGIDVLLTRTMRMPTVLVLEDTQWIDDASRSLLAHLVRSPVAKPWLVCVTRRPEGEPIAAGASGAVIALRPLPVDAATAVAREAAGSALRPAELDRIVARSGGNPFFVRELTTTRDSYPALPGRVESLLRERLNDLGDDERLLLVHAAAIGRSFDLALLRETLDGTTLAGRVDERMSTLAGFVEELEPDRFRFRHDLFQEAAYAELADDRRPEVHARVATALEGRAGTDARDLSPELALHFGEAGDLDKTWHYAVQAGRRAQNEYANRVAAELYERALAAAEHLSAVPIELPGVVESLGDVYVLAGEATRAASMFERADACAADDLARARIRRKQGQCCTRSDDFDEAWSWLKSALELVQDPPESPEEVVELAEIELELGAVTYFQGRFDVAARWGDKALQRAESGSDRRLLARAYDHLETTQDLSGGKRSTRLRVKALAIHEELGDVVGEATLSNNLGLCAYFDGRWEEALRFYRRANSLDRTIGNDNALVGGNLVNEAEILSDQGRLEDAKMLLEEARTVYDARGSAFGAALATGALGRLAARSARHVEAEALLIEALATLEAIGAKGSATETRARIAEAHLLAGEHRRAYELATRILEAEKNEMTAYTGLIAQLERTAGYAAFQNHEPDVAADHFRRSMEAAEKDGVTYESALTLIAAAELAERTSLEEPAILRAEGQEILDRLGVVAVPAVPLPDTFFEPHEHRL